MRTSTVLTLIAFSCVLWAGAASSEEIPPPTELLVSGGILCDTEEDLHILLSGISLNGGDWPDNPPASCGQFVPEMPVLMTVTPLEWYETPMANVLTAHFVYVPNGWEQFGYLGVKMNQPLEPTF